MQRKRGAQPGNSNAVTHGRHTAAGRAARLAALKAAFEEQQQRSEQWRKAARKTDYSRIVEHLRAEKRKGEND